MSAEKIFRKLITAHQNPNDNSDEYNLGYVDAMKMAINQVTKESKQPKDRQYYVNKHGEKEYLDGTDNDQALKDAALLRGVPIQSETNQPKDEHQCVHCGATTTQSDDECYMKPQQQSVDVFVFKVEDYTTTIIGRYDKEKDCYYVQRGDGTRYNYDTDRITQITSISNIINQDKCIHKGCNQPVAKTIMCQLHSTQRRRKIHSTMTVTEYWIELHGEPCSDTDHLMIEFAQNYVNYSVKNIEQLPQAQYDLTSQLQELRVVANKLGLYDAADFLTSKEKQLVRKSIQDSRVTHCVYGTGTVTKDDGKSYVVVKFDGYTPRTAIPVISLTVATEPPTGQRYMNGEDFARMRSDNKFILTDVRSEVDVSIPTICRFEQGGNISHPKWLLLDQFYQKYRK